MRIHEMISGEKYTIVVTKADISGYPVGLLKFTGTPTEEYKNEDNTEYRLFIKCHDFNIAYTNDFLWLIIDQDEIDSLNRLFTGTLVEVEKEYDIRNL